MRELKHDAVDIYVYLNISRTPPGVRELKLRRVAQSLMHGCRTPPGVRELKLQWVCLGVLALLSHPSRGA